MNKKKIAMGAVLGAFLLVCWWQLRPHCDLGVSILKLTPAHPKPGEPVTVSYRVTNLGPDKLPTRSYQTLVTVNGATVNFDLAGNQGPLGVGQYVEYSRVPGSHDFMASSTGKDQVHIEVSPKRLFLIDPDPSNDTVSTGVP